MVEDAKGIEICKETLSRRPSSQGDIVPDKQNCWTLLNTIITAHISNRVTQMGEEYMHYLPSEHSLPTGNGMKSCMLMCSG